VNTLGLYRLTFYLLIWAFCWLLYFDNKACIPYSHHRHLCFRCTEESYTHNKIVCTLGTQLDSTARICPTRPCTFSESFMVSVAVLTTESRLQSCTSWNWAWKLGVIIHTVLWWLKQMLLPEIRAVSDTAGVSAGQLHACSQRT